MKTNSFIPKVMGAVALLTALPYCVITAQEVDFSTQRNEVQVAPRVSGYSVNHGGIVINPTPQTMMLDTARRIAVPKGFRIRSENVKMNATDFEGLIVRTDGLPLLLRRGSSSENKEQSIGKRTKRGHRALIDAPQPETFEGAYVLAIGQNGVEITGHDETGVFYGLQTLRQLLESKNVQQRGLPTGYISDHPALPFRGVVEGFYGTPWSHRVRLNLIDFYSRMKMNTYVYGPKDDPYHSSPHWREPYPEQEARQITELIERCRLRHVNFVWAIHPGKDIQWNENDYRNIVAKFEKMYQLGVRHFAIFFDDIQGEGTNPVRQVELLNRLQREFVKTRGDVGALTVCPTDYSRLWANPSEQGALAIYGKMLDPSVNVFWTGDVVCSDLTPQTLDWVNSRIKRPAYYWWNYPVTDYCRNYLLQGPVYGLDCTITAKQTRGVLSNPMEHGEASKLALYGVADYAWNPRAYNALDNWERGLTFIAPGAADAYRTFAIHSSDTESGYRRDESWETHTFTWENWNDADATALDAQMKVAEDAPDLIAHAVQPALLEEIKPWLEQFSKLASRVRGAIALGKLYRNGVNEEEFWQHFIHNRMTDADRKEFDAHRVGTMKLQPFYERLMDDLCFQFGQKVLTTTPKMYRPIGNFPNSQTISAKLMLDGDTTTYYTSGVSQHEGSWIGLDLRTIQAVSEIHILQGRNSTDDTDYLSHCVVQSSLDGQTWTNITDSLQNTYDILWKGTPISARYVRLLRLPSQQRNHAAIRVFDVNTVRPSDLGVGLGNTTPKTILRAFDSNLLTSYELAGELKLTKPHKENTLHIVRSNGGQMVVQLYNRRRHLLKTWILSKLIERIPLPRHTTYIHINGVGSLAEIWFGKQKK